MQIQLEHLGVGVEHESIFLMISSGADKMAQRVKMIADKPDNSSLIPEYHVVEENQVL